MSKLLAPNGKPSNLTAEQYKLVRTPAFKEWFGDWEKSPKTASKVVDKNGEPMVCFHGTENKFNIFKISNFGQLGKGIYFSNYYNEAKEYSELNNSKKAKVIGVFLNIKNPKYSTNYELKNSELFMGESNEVYERLINLRYDGIIFKFEKITSRGDKYISLPTGQLEINAFNPAQIKLADGTNTTFDSSNPDIRFNDGGSILLAPNGKPSKLTPEQYKIVRTPAFKKWFGDWENDPANSSKVIDEETKEPLVVFHGTNEEFNIFNKSTRGAFGKGFYFTQDLKEAKGYGKKIIEVFINIKNPANIKQVQGIMLNIKDRRYLEDSIFSEKITEQLLLNNFDGVIFEYANKDKFVVSLHSNQIKLADGSNTTFDGNNTDIRFDNGGFVKVKSFETSEGDFDVYDLDENHKHRADMFVVFKDKKGWVVRNVIVPTEFQRKGLATNFYINMNKMSLKNTGKPLHSTQERKLSNGQIVHELSEDGIALWDSLVRDGYAKKISEKNYVFIHNKFSNGGLIAPNGKPSKLTAEQYELVRTPAFKEWFGDWENDPANASKVVDSNGEPMVLFHGTPYSDFNTLDGTYRGIWFSEDVEVAQRYKDKRIEDWEQQYSDEELDDLMNGRRMLNVFLKGKKIYDLSTFDSSERLEKKDFFKRFPVKLDWKGWGSRTTNHWEFFETNYNVIKKWLLENDYDCIKIKEDGYMTYCIFDSNQVKLADGSNTTFDSGNSDIRYAGGGEIKKVNIDNVKQFYIKNKNYRFVEILEKKSNKIEVYQESDGKYYGLMLYRQVPRYIPKFSSPMVSDVNQLYAYVNVENKELFNAVKHKKKPFGSFRFWFQDYTEDDINKEIKGYISECSKYNLDYKVTKESRYVIFEFCQKGTFDELFNIDDLIEDYNNNGFGDLELKGIKKFRNYDLSYFLNNEWDANGVFQYPLTGLILGIPPKFTMSILNMWTTYDLSKEYKYDFKPIIIEKSKDKLNTGGELDNSNPDIRFKDGGNVNKNLKEVEVSNIIYHRSNPIFREKIKEKGLIPKGKSETWLSDTEINGKVIFATNSTDENDLFDSGYDDDIYEIDTSKINNKWYLDPNFDWSDEYNHIITFEPIPNSAIKIIYMGSGLSKDSDEFNELLEKKSKDKFNTGGELDEEKVEKIKTLILKNYPHLESLDLIGKGLNGYAFSTLINNEVYVVKYSRSITEYWLTKMASVSNPPNVVKFEEVKQISNNNEYVIIHKWLSRDAMPNKNAWEVGLGNTFKEYREGIKSIPKKELEYVMNLSKKLYKSLVDYFGFMIDTNQDNWGYDENNKLLLFDLDGNVSKSQYEEWMNKHYNNSFEKGGELNTGIFSQIWEWFGIKF